MSRPVRSRRICSRPRFTEFSPKGCMGNEPIELTLDEYEVIRLVDHENKTHEECAVFMDISRTTVTEIYSQARAKIADSIVNGRPIIIDGGNYRFCSGEAKCCMNKCNRNK